MSDEEMLAEVSNEDTVIDDRKHTQLVNSILAITGKRNRAERRTLPGKVASPANFDTGKGKVRLHELTSSLRSSSSHNNLKKQLALLTSRGKVVDTPLPKHQQLKVDRSVAYDDSAKEFSKWSSIILANRKAEQLKFPLEQCGIKIHNLSRATHMPRTPLEIEVDQLLQTSYVNTDNKYRKLTSEERKARLAMSLAEARERHAELRRHRIRVSYRTTKETREKKIKSRGFRRQKRRERLKVEQSELDKMKTDDPEAYLDKMKEADNARVRERLTLKHRKSSKFAKRTLAFAKFDEQARKSIKEMLEKKRELKRPQLTEVVESSGGEEEEEDEGRDVEMVDGSTGAPSNPWMKASVLSKKIKIKSQETIDSENKRVLGETSGEDPGFVVESGSSAVQGDGEKEVNPVSFSTDCDKVVDVEEIEADIDDMFDELEKSTHSNDKKRMKVGKNVKGSGGKNTAVDLKRNSDKLSIDDDDDDDDDDDECRRGKNTKPDTKLTEKPQAEVFVDPKQVLQINNTIQSFEMPAGIEDNSEDEDDDGGGGGGDGQMMDINEAFADDNVVDDFTSEKAEHIESRRVKDVNLFLPGWGSWGGAGVNVDEEKRERFTVKAPAGIPRRDYQLGNVILNEKKDDAIAKYQINKLPFPFKSTTQLEKSIQTPVGRTWNPETSFKELTRPKIVTRLGTIIDPINKEKTFKKHKSVKVGGKRTSNNGGLTVSDNKIRF